MALRCIDNGAALNAHARGAGVAALRRPKSAVAPVVAAPAPAEQVAPVAEEPAAAALGCPPPLDAEMPFNPFCNAVAGIGNPYEVTKTVLLLPVFLLRIVAFVGLLLLGLLFTKLALLGAKDVLTKPFPSWRRALLWPVRILARALLFTCGFHWIRIKGRPAPRQVAPILVCNHVTFVDPVFLFYMHLPVVTSAEENLRYPIVGAIISAMQVIAINRGCPDSRRAASGEIKRRAQCNDWNNVMVFPEATTTNAKSLVSFKSGAFTPGLPVQPMLVRYSYVHCDPSWVALGPSVYFLLFRLMTQFHNFMEVEYLPVMEPTFAEQRTPRLFTQRVRLTMAKSLNVMVTQHSFEDLRLILEAQKHGDYSATPVVEFGALEKLHARLDVKEIKSYYFKFRDLDVASRGTVTLEDFCTGVGLPTDSEHVRKVFALCDTQQLGFFNFRQYVNALAFLSRFDRLAETIQAAYGLCDRDGDGLLCFQDVSGSLRELIPSMSMAQVNRIWNAITTSTSSSTASTSSSSSSSSSSSGRHVNSSQFVDFMERNPEYVALFLYARQEQHSGGA